MTETPKQKIVESMHRPFELVARARANQGDTLKVERRNGSTQKEVTITSTNEDRLDMNEGNFSIF